MQMQINKEKTNNPNEKWSKSSHKRKYRSFLHLWKDVQPHSLLKEFELNLQWDIIFAYKTGKDQRWKSCFECEETGGEMGILK